MAFVTEPPRLSHLLKMEEDPSYCREEVTVLAGSGSDRELQIGTVLGRITASGKVVGLNLAASDGSQTVWGVLISNTTAPDGLDATGVALVRGPAIVSDAALIYPAGATAPQKTTINSALIMLGIIVRQGV
ncbi:MAG: head decoration protein [Rhodospirillaceae bacterium]